MAHYTPEPAKRFYKLFAENLGQYSQMCDGYLCWGNDKPLNPARHSWYQSNQHMYVYRRGDARSHQLGLCIRSGRSSADREFRFLRSEIDVVAPWFAQWYLAASTAAPLPPPPVPVTEQLEQYGRDCRYLWTQASLAAWRNRT